MSSTPTLPLELVHRVLSHYDPLSYEGLRPLLTCALVSHSFFSISRELWSLGTEIRLAGRCRKSLGFLSLLQSPHHTFTYPLRLRVEITTYHHIIYSGQPHKNPNRSFTHNVITACPVIGSLAFTVTASQAEESWRNVPELLGAALPTLRRFELVYRRKDTALLLQLIEQLPTSTKLEALHLSIPHGWGMTSTLPGAAPSTFSTLDLTTNSIDTCFPLLDWVKNGGAYLSKLVLHAHLPEGQFMQEQFVGMVEQRIRSHGACSRLGSVYGSVDEERNILHVYGQ